MLGPYMYPYMYPLIEFLQEPSEADPIYPVFIERNQRSEKARNLPHTQTHQ